jgi:hypothetical protein
MRLEENAKHSLPKIQDREQVARGELEKKGFDSLLDKLKCQSKTKGICLSRDLQGKVAFGIRSFVEGVFGINK